MAFKRMISLLLALLLCFGTAAMAEGTDTPQFVMAGYDSTQYRDWLNNLFFVRMEERTGIKFVYQQYTDAAAWQKVKDQMTAGDANLPDVLFKASLGGAECIELREKGVLIDLKPYLQENCPNLWAILEANPDYLEAITLPDGSIAALPYIAEPSAQNYLWVNREWLTTLRLEEPTTAQELIDVLTAFRDRDPNRNGKKDEIPMGFLGPFDLKFLAHAFGLIANDYNVYTEDGTVKFMPLQENYRLFVTWCRDLYKEGLLDKNGFSYTDDMRTVTDSNATAVYGIILTSMAADLFQVSWAENYEIMMPLSFDGQQVYRDFAGPLLRGTFAITSHCKEPEKMLQWVDFLYSQEGAILASIGQEDTDYLVDGDGTWRLLDSNQSNYDMYRAGTLIEGGAEGPGVMTGEFQGRISGGALVQTILAKQEQFCAYLRMPFPYYTLTEEQEARIAPLQAEIGYYVDVQLARWVLGEEEITDESFSQFEQHLNELGLDQFLAFWQDILDRQ